ncbi:MAG: hypothetical protein OIF38_06740, partial [Cellvibrionaceae bacterium]|nr:hypothetical protein [Cellvibrionaceae bacterium]
VSVSSLQTSNGDWITLESVDGHSLSSVASQYPVAGPSGYAFPYGTISFSAAVGSGGTGNATEFRILVPRNDNIVGYWKRDIDGVLVDVNTVAGSNLNIDHSSFAGRTEITFSITEGSRIDTDSDPETITDPGGPVVIASAASAGQVAVPALPLGFLLAMPLALLGLAGWRRKG